MPKIGAYIISHNYRDFVDWAIKSMVAQTRQPDVFIFYDDASIDDTMAIVMKNFTHVKFDKIIVNAQNKGAVASMNEVVKMLGEEYGCEYIVGLSADDTFHPEYIAKAEKVLSEAAPEVGYVYSWVRRIGDENSIDAHPEWDYQTLMRTPFINGSAMIKYAAWKSVGGLPDIKREEDWAMYRAMAERGWKGKLIVEPDGKKIPYVRWRKHNLGCRTNMDDAKRAERLKNVQR